MKLKFSVLVLSLFWTIEVKAQTPAQCFENPSLCQKSTPTKVNKSASRKKSPPSKPRTLDVIGTEFKKFDFKQRNQIQKALSNMGLYNSSIDGIYGKGTRNSIEAYLDKMGIEDPLGTEVSAALKELFTAKKEIEDNSAKGSETADLAILPKQSTGTFILPFSEATKNQAIILLQDIEDSIKEDSTLLPGEDKLEFAKIYSVIRSVNENKWSRKVEEGMVALQDFASKHPLLRDSVKEKSQIRKDEREKRVSKVRIELSSNLSLAKEWVSENLFAPQVPELLKIIEASEKALVDDDILMLSQNLEMTKSALMKYEVIPNTKETIEASSQPSEDDPKETNQEKPNVRKSSLSAQYFQFTLIGNQTVVGDGFTNYRAQEGYTLMLLTIEFSGSNSIFADKSFSISVNTSSNGRYVLSENASEAFAAQEGGSYLKKEFSPDIGSKYFIVVETPLTDSEFSSLSVEKN